MSIRKTFAALFGGVAITILTAAPARADSITLGLLQFSTFGDSAVMFSIVNATDVLLDSGVIFDDAMLVLEGSAAISLGNITPGTAIDGFSNAALLFGSDAIFQSATFSAVLSLTTLTAADGTAFLADPTITAQLTHSDGSALAADFDFVSIDATPASSPSPVPEPSTLLLLVTGIAMVVRRRAGRKSSAHTSQG